MREFGKGAVGVGSNKAKKTRSSNLALAVAILQVLQHNAPLAPELQLLDIEPDLPIETFSPPS